MTDPAPQQPAPPTPQTDGPARQRPAWLVPTIAAAAALIVGFGAGWYGHQAYLVSVVEDAVGDMGEAMGEPMPAEEDGGAAAEEESGPKAPTEEKPSDGLHTYSEPLLGQAVPSFEDESTATAYEETDGAEYVPVTVTVENSSQAETIPGYEIAHAYDTEGTQYTSMATLGEGAGFGLSPGLSAEVEYYFQVPTGTRLEWVTLQEEAAPETAALRLGG